MKYVYVYGNNLVFIEEGVLKYDFCLHASKNNKICDDLKNTYLVFVENLVLTPCTGDLENV